MRLFLTISLVAICSMIVYSAPRPGNEFPGAVHEINRNTGRDCLFSQSVSSANYAIVASTAVSVIGTNQSIVLLGDWRFVVEDGNLVMQKNVNGIFVTQGTLISN